MKIYNDTIQYNEPEVAYNGGWFQKEADFAKVSDFLNRKIGITLTDNIALHDLAFISNISINLFDRCKTKDITTILTQYSVSLVDVVDLKDDGKLCCLTLNLVDNAKIHDFTNLMLMVKVKDGVALFSPVQVKCHFKINAADFVPITEIFKYGLNGEQIIWQWNDILSDNQTPWKNIERKTSTWIDRNKITTKYTDRVVPNKF